jgi:hypothetical protein
MAIKMQQRRGTAAEWTSANPTLAAGEIGFESDTFKFKIGDGSTAWSALKYYATATDLETDITATTPIIWTANLPGVVGTQATITFDQNAQNTTNDSRYVKLSANNTISPASTAGIALTVNGLASQTANLQNWSVDGTVKAQIDKDGTFTTISNINTTTSDTSGTLGIVNASRIRLGDTTDVSTTSTRHALQIGPSSGQLDRLLIDANEIHVYNEQPLGTVIGSTLTLNGDGGPVSIASANATATTTVNGPLVTATGTSTIAPLRMPSGATLTTATAGVIEFDGKSFYATPTTGGRAYIPSTHYYSLTTARTQATPATGTLYDIFGVSFAVAANTTYEVEMLFTASNPGTVANTLNLAFTPTTATFTSIGYSATTTNGTALSTPNAASTTYFAVNTASTISASIAAATARTVFVKGLIRIGTAGTIKPQYSHTGAPGNTTTIGVNSYIKLTPISSDTNTSIGTWA